MRILRICAFLLVTSGLSLACVRSLFEVTRGNSFSVGMKMDGGPLKAVRVVLIARNGERIEAQTDQLGIAYFDGIATGQYTLVGERLGIGSSGVQRVVVVDNGSSKRITLTWPDSGYYAYTAAMATGRFGNGKRVPKTKLTLTRVDSEKEIISFTDSEGNYAFPLVEPGFYLMAAEEEVGPEGEVSRTLARVRNRIKVYFLVHIDPKSSIRTLDLSLGFSDCGWVASQVSNGKWVDNHPQETQVGNDLQRIQKAVTAYGKQTGSLPDTILSLVSAGFLPAIPVDPNGKPYRLGPDGVAEPSDPDDFPELGRHVPN